MSEVPDRDGPDLPQRGRWLIVGGLSLLALPVTFSFFLFGLVAAQGCFVDCVEADPRPVHGTLLALGAGVMGGGWAGLVPWAMGRPGLIARTFLAGVALVLTAFGLFVVLG